jgi:hypothetical protein
MATVTIDVDALTDSLRKATQAVLPWVKLQVVDYGLNEPTPPPLTVNSSPVVMTEPALVPHVSYQWTYKDTRQVVIDYVLQRGTDWQSGRIKIFHDMDIDYLASLNEPTPPPIPTPYTAHHLYFSHTIDLVVGSDIGVTLCALHVPASEAEEKFGLGFQITSATPSKFPLVGGSYVSVIPLT